MIVVDVRHRFSARDGAGCDVMPTLAASSAKAAVCDVSVARRPMAETGEADQRAGA
jgi:hypothetical protein